MIFSYEEERQPSDVWSREDNSNPLYLGDNESECFGYDYSWYYTSAWQVTRSFPHTVELEDGHVMEFLYDEDMCLVGLKKDGSILREYTWYYDAYSGRMILESVWEGGISLKYTDKAVTISGLYGESRYIPDFFESEWGWFDFHYGEGEYRHIIIRTGHLWMLRQESA